jgi:hypothetical protein
MKIDFCNGGIFIRVRPKKLQEGSDAQDGTAQSLQE